MSKLNVEVYKHIENDLGPLMVQDLLFGMGAGRVFKATLSGREVVIKQSTKDVERLFYEKLSHNVNEVGVKTPKLIGSGKMDTMNWVVIEFIPHELPKSRWQDDEEVISTVAKLHDLHIDHYFLRINNSKH